jgi:hypothetical protein
VQVHITSLRCVHIPFVVKSARYASASTGYMLTEVPDIPLFVCTLNGHAPCTFSRLSVNYVMCDDC